jgi:hypothetical protein
MKRDRLNQIVALGVLIVALLASSGLAVQLTASGGRNRLGYADTMVEGQPPQVALGIAMGAFRGVFVNMLWIRANQLKEDGRFYEAMDLSKAITTLQPRFPHVWAFHAWNMAYNISVNSQTPQERWKWINAGINLLRNQGIVHNPNDMLVHKELAWILLHKVGAYMDDANPYYKRQLAGEWSLVLGPPPPIDPSYKDRDKAKAKFVAWLRPILEAPETLEGVYARNPAVVTLVDRVRKEVGLEPDWRLNQNSIILQTIARSGERAGFEQGFDAKQRALLTLLEDSTLQSAWADLLAHIRKRVLEDDYHMEPERMVRLTEKYGPLDWRHWGSHALYWASRGVEHAFTRVSRSNVKDFDFLNANRVAVHSLQDLWRTGDMYFDLLGYIKAPHDPNVFLRISPNVHFMDAYGENLDEFIGTAFMIGRNFESRDRAYGLMAAGYENFRKDAIRFLYRRGERELAEKMKDELGVWPHHNTNDPDRKDLFKLNIDDFVMKELEDQLTRPSVAREEVVGALQGAFASLLAGTDSSYFRSQLDYAAKVHAFFFTNQGRHTLVALDKMRMEQMDSDFRVVAGSEFASLMAILELDDAERLYDSAPENLKWWAYDLIAERFKPTLDELAKAGGRKFEQVFPEPENMAEHRAEIQKMIQDRQNRPQVEMQ